MRDPQEKARREAMETAKQMELLKCVPRSELGHPIEDWIGACGALVVVGVGIWALIWMWMAP